MPIYEFHCENCDLHFEKRVNMDEIAPCPACEKEFFVTKQVSAPATYSIKGDNSASVSPKSHNNG